MISTPARAAISAAIALLSATALALSVAIPASAATSVTGTKSCVGTPYTPKYTISATGSWYTEQRAYPATGPYNGFLFYTGGPARSFWGASNSIQYIAGHNIPPGNIVSHSSTCA